MERAKRTLSLRQPRYADIVIDQLLLWIVIPGILGARLYHVMDWWEYYAQNPWKMLAIWEGGIGIYGALLGGFLGILGYLFLVRRREVRKTSLPTSLAMVLDLCAFGLPLGQAFGRMGNYFNQELFGTPTQVPWAIFIDAMHRPSQYLQYTHFHPLFAYEAVLNLFVASCLWWQLHRPYPLGAFFAQYLVGYGIIRFSLDFLRVDPWRMGFFTTAQWVSLALLLIGLGWLFVLWARQRVRKIDLL